MHMPFCLEQNVILEMQALRNGGQILWILKPFKQLKFGRCTTKINLLFCQCKEHCVSSICQ